MSRAELIPGVSIDPRRKASVRAPWVASWLGGPGWRSLVPGLAQWQWGQRERGIALGGLYLSSLATGVFLWGSAAALGLIAFAFLTHAYSTLDALGRSAAPALGRRGSQCFLVGWLAFGIYAPLLGSAAVLAWPGGFGSDEGFLVNCWAYRAHEPEQGDLVWYRPNRWSEARPGRVVAEGGQTLEWDGGILHVNGQVCPLKGVLHSGPVPRTASYRIPADHLLIRSEAASDALALVIVEGEDVLGRIWARSYPIRRRTLLH